MAVLLFVFNLLCDSNKTILFYLTEGTIGALPVGIPEGSARQDEGTRVGLQEGIPRHAAAVGCTKAKTNEDVRTYYFVLVAYGMVC